MPITLRALRYFYQHNEPVDTTNGQTVITRCGDGCGERGSRSPPEPERISGVLESHGRMSKGNAYKDLSSNPHATAPSSLDCGLLLVKELP